MIIDKANIFNFSALPTEIIPFDETTLNVIIRDLPKSYPFDIVLFDGTKHTITKELDLYDFLLMDYYETFNEHLEIYKQKVIDNVRLAEELRLQKLADKELQEKHKAATVLAMQEHEAARLEFIEKYGDANTEERLEIDKHIFIEKAIERNEIKKHNERVKRQLDNNFNVSLAQYDSKYLDCEISLFDKLRTDSTLFINTGSKTIFLVSYYNSNYSSSVITFEELINKILRNADERDSYISALISKMKDDLKAHIKE